MLACEPEAASLSAMAKLDRIVRRLMRMRRGRLMAGARRTTSRALGPFLAEITDSVNESTDTSNVWRSQQKPRTTEEVLSRPSARFPERSFVPSTGADSARLTAEHQEWPGRESDTSGARRFAWQLIKWPLRRPF